MTKKTQRHMSRRGLLKALAAVGAGTAVGAPLLLRSRTARSDGGKPPKFLFVMAGFGGASIIDAALAIRESESASASTINAFPDAEVVDIAGSPLRAVDLSRDSIGAIPQAVATRQSDFFTKHRDDIMVATYSGTSVNHTIAQHRSITGNGAFRGRTLQEMVALEYGADCPLPNVNMGQLGFLENGTDRSLPGFAYAEPVAQPFLWPLSLDGSRGIQDAPDRELVEAARQVRNQQLDPNTGFYKTFRASEKLQKWQQQRGVTQPGVEIQDLITKLNFIAERPGIPWSQYGLSESPDSELLGQIFPSAFTDPLEAQAALAFLLVKHRVSVSVTMSATFNLVVTGEGIVNPPLAFDVSHNAHRAGQAQMWKRMMGMADRLIDLLKTEEYEPNSGESLWDHSMIYFATDFGRSKTRQQDAPEFGTAHHLNNGCMIMSPRANGNTVLGGVDPDTALTYGFDPQTGAPDLGREMNEGEIYGGILQALDVDLSGSGLTDMKAMRKA